MSADPETAEDAMLGRLEVLARLTIAPQRIDWYRADINALKFVLETRAELLRLLALASAGLQEHAEMETQHCWDDDLLREIDAALANCGQ